MIKSEDTSESGNDVELGDIMHDEEEDNGETATAARGPAPARASRRAPRKQAAAARSDEREQTSNEEESEAEEDASQAQRAPTKRARIAALSPSQPRMWPKQAPAPAAKLRRKLPQ